LHQNLLHCLSGEVYISLDQLVVEDQFLKVGSDRLLDQICIGEALSQHRDRTVALSFHFVNQAARFVNFLGKSIFKFDYFSVEFLREVCLKLAQVLLKLLL